MDGVVKRKNIEALAELRSCHYKSWRTNRLSPSRRRQRQALRRWRQSRKPVKTERIGLNCPTVNALPVSTAIKKIASKFWVPRNVRCGVVRCFVLFCLLDVGFLCRDGFLAQTPRRQRTIFHICIGFHKNSIKCLLHRAACFGQAPSKKSVDRSFATQTVVQGLHAS